jgi:hypothetical protein
VIRGRTEFDALDPMWQSLAPGIHAPNPFINECDAGMIGRMVMLG